MTSQQKPLSQTIEEMQTMARRLVPLSYPKVSLIEDADVEILKRRQITVDGYNLSVMHNRADYEDCFVETLEIIGVDFPFLPMFLLCKVAALFLGKHELKYAESHKAGRKCYIWSVAVDDRGRPIPLDNPVLRNTSFEGFEFGYVQAELL